MSEACGVRTVNMRQLSLSVCLSVLLSVYLSVYEACRVTVKSRQIPSVLLPVLLSVNLSVFEVCGVFLSVYLSVCYMLSLVSHASPFT